MHSVQISPFRRRQVQTSDVYGMHIHQLIKRMEGNEVAACIMFLVFFRLEIFEAGCMAEGRTSVSASWISSAGTQPPKISKIFLFRPGLKFASGDRSGWYHANLSFEPLM